MSKEYSLAMARGCSPGHEAGGGRPCCNLRGNEVVTTSDGLSIISRPKTTLPKKMIRNSRMIFPRSLQPTGGYWFSVGNLFRNHWMVHFWLGCAFPGVSGMILTIKLSSIRARVALTAQTSRMAGWSWMYRFGISWTYSHALHTWHALMRHLRAGWRERSNPELIGISSQGVILQDVENPRVTT
ncbi:hypothetical protein BDZ89DRAFT_1035541 [Hymenopellis radicata]|nr:hypothetical protein BDZ89DRAFT_1035541 [Hymenopellis radicata]